jgi:hypothetical protein
MIDKTTESSSDCNEAIRNASGDVRAKVPYNLRSKTDYENNQGNRMNSNLEAQHCLEQPFPTFYPCRTP